MASKRILKIIITILIVLFTVSMFSQCSYARVEAGAGGGGGGSSNPNFNLDTFEDGEGDSTINSSAETIVGSILSVIRIVCLGIAIVIITALAMKYMMAAPGDRAEVKKSAIQYVVGAVVMFSAATILNLIIEFTNGIVG